MRFTDGLKSFINQFVNYRQASASNYFDPVRLKDTDMRGLYRSGLGNKIVRLKTAAALADGVLQFDNEDDEAVFKSRLLPQVKTAAKWGLVFGRGVLVLHHRGDDLAKAYQRKDALPIVSVFSGDMVLPVGGAVLDLQHPRYMQPRAYAVRGQTIHASRVIDFRYVLPPEMEAAQYRYGGISEFELIYDQLVADGVMQRACPQVVDKSSRLFYHVKGFKSAMQTGQEGDMARYFSQLEDSSGIFSAGILDAEDQVIAIAQALSNLAEADQITLRRLALVTGIPLSVLVGENVRGLNSTGDNEMAVWQGTVEALQDDHLFDPINQLARAVGLGPVKFADNQGETALARVDYEGKAIDNAVKLYSLGEDHTDYLRDKGLAKVDPSSSLDGLFPDSGDA